MLPKACSNMPHLAQEEGDKVDRPAWKGFLCHEFGVDSKDNGGSREDSKKASDMARTKPMAAWS